MEERHVNWDGRNEEGIEAIFKSSRCDWGELARVLQPQKRSTRVAGDSLQGPYCFLHHIRKLAIRLNGQLYKL